MIRQPLPRRWRIGLGVASVLLLIGFYTLLSHGRQNATRREQLATAETQLANLADTQRSLAERRQQLESRADEPARQRDLERLQRDEARAAQALEKWTAIQQQPDATELTVPTWSVLWKQGLIRACTPQGSFERKEVWIVTDFWATAKRLVTALVLGVLLSLLLGLLMGCYDPLESFLQPPFAFFSKVPATAVLPVFFVLFQINFKMYLAIIVFGMLPTLAQSISQCVRKDVPDELVFKAYTLGASQFELIWEVVLRQILPRVLDSARLQIGPSLVLLVAAEWMVAGEGIGYRLRLFYQRTDMTVVFVYVILLGIVGLAVDYGLIWIRRKLCPWFGD